MRKTIQILGILLLGAGTASAYELKRTGTGEPLRWRGDSDVDIVLAMRSKTDLSADAATTAARQAFETWGAAMIGGLAFHFEDTARSPVISPRDGHNVIAWVERGWDEDFDPDALAVTMTTYTENGQITDADIAVNAERYRWSLNSGSCRDAYDLQNVLTHEVGHLLGLGHDRDHQDATMFPTAGACETAKRDLASEDIAGATYLYLELGPPALFDGGCSVGQGGAGGTGALLLLVGVVLVLRRRRVAVALAGILVLGGTAAATTVRRIELPELGQTAAVVARAHVVSRTPVLVGERIYTDTLLAVEECLKGACGEELVVRQLGGELDGVGMTVEGLAPLAGGDEVILFLRARKDGAFAPVGMAQGAFHVRRGVAERSTDGLELVGTDGVAVQGRIERYSLEDLRKAARSHREPSIVRP
jgi:MYXO-CTERM domain-containing protein